MKSMPTTMMGTRTSSMHSILLLLRGLHRGEFGFNLVICFKIGNFFFQRPPLRAQAHGVSAPFGKIHATFQQLEARDDVMTLPASIKFPTAEAILGALTSRPTAVLADTCCHHPP